MFRLAPLVIAFAAVFVVRTARADVEDVDSTYDPGRAERRADFAAGISMGAMLGRVTGYPKKPEKIDVAEFRSSTGAAGGAGGGFWLGGALRDWLVMGFGVTFGSIASGDARLSNGGAFVGHIEGFPLFHRGGAWRDLALVGEFGVGGRDLFNASRKTADGGTMSYISMGLLYEPIRVGDRSLAGPIVMVSHQFSDSMRAVMMTAGIHVAFYGGPGS